ncbi:MAG TPA: helix-turn-helix domain-containing protein [Myxococcota bacterium]|nr:helix-turn-helix domain-containing protein [Myxococcota bacterium]
MPGPVALPRVVQARASILEAARELFAARGLHEVTMADVAEAAGVARATVFNHFGTKHALVDAITAEVLHGYVLLLDGALADRRAPTPVLLRMLFEWMGRGIEEDERFYRAIFREIAKLSLGLDEGSEAEAKRRVALERLLALHTRGQARDELVRTQPAEHLASAFDALVFGTIIHWLYEDPGEPLHLRMLRAADLLLGGIAVQPEAEYRGPAPQLLPADALANRPARRTGAPARRRRRHP